MKNESKLSEQKPALSAAKQALLQKRLQGKLLPRRHGPSTIPKRPSGQAPLSFSQQPLFFLDQLDSDSAAYNFSIAVRLNGTLNVPVLAKALNEIIRRHDALRTQFVIVDLEPVQQVLPALSVSIVAEDLAGLAKPELARLINHESRMPFDLAKCPLLRVRLFRLSEGHQHGQEHVLLITMPHIITDGWSAAVLYRELATLYEAYVQGLPSPLPELPIQYTDFSHWQRQQLQEEVLAKMFAFWQGHLSASDADFELPTDRVRPAVQTYNGSEHAFFLAKGLAENLQQLCRKRNVTLFALLLAAFNVLLHRYTGATHICVGSPVANRNTTEIEALIGFFVNVLALHTDLSGNPKFTDLLDRTQGVMLDTQPHQAYPFELLVKKLNLVRDPSFNPLFQVMFVLHNVPFGSIQVSGLEITPFPIENTVSKFDLTLHVTEASDGLRASFEYNVDLFDEGTIARMASHFRVMLEHIAAAPETRISELRLLTPQENQPLAVASRPNLGIYADSPAHGLIHTVIEQQALRVPSAIAVSGNGLTLTYAELNAKANQLAHYLLGKGLKSGDTVALCIGRRPEMIVGILAVLKAGGAYLPIDPYYPRNEIAYLLEDSGAALVLIRKPLVAVLPESSKTLPLVFIDDDWAALAEQPAVNPPPASSLEHPAYIIYTSGSTGKPKGVAVSHRNLLHSTQARFAYYQSPVTSFLLLSSFAFDSSVAGLFWTLGQGGKLCIPTDSTHTDPAFLVEWIRTKRVSHLLCLPSFHSILLEQADAVQLESLQAVIVAGEACSAKVARQHYDRLPATALYNEYGPTEGSVWCTVYRIPPGQADDPIPIGHPIPGVQIYLLDAYLNPVPVGVHGELYIGGDGVAIGYLNQAAGTAERFIANPFGIVAGGRLYRTGDRVRYRADGTLMFLGRTDQQLKIRGFRVELGEIESKLLKHPAIEMAVVNPDETPSGSKRLVAYLVPKQGECLADSDGVRAFLHNQLPGYMIPSAFVVMDQLPLTANGKVDRKALALAAVRETVEGRYAAPRTPTEETLCVIWAQVLGLEKVGIQDNFFEIGGDSILSMQLVNRAKQAGLSLTPRHILECQTVGALAQVIGHSQDIQAEQGIITGDVPLTPIQRWFFAQAYPNPNYWNQAVLLDVGLSVNPALLSVVLQRLLDHHDILRSYFHRCDNGWQQVLPESAESAPDIVLVDLSALAEDARPAALAEQAAHWQGSLNLSHGPLLRVVCFDYGPDANSRLLVIVHHLVMDGVSWRILLEDLDTLYQQALDEREMRLPRKSSAFKLWSERLTAYAQTESAERNASYWLNTDWRRAVLLPIDQADGANSEATSKVLSVSLCSTKTSQILQNAPRIGGARINEVLLAAVVKVLAEWTQSRSVLLEMEGHGREALFDNVDIARTVGWFTALFPVLFEMPIGQSFPESVQSVQRQLAAIPNHGLDYGVVRYLSGNSELVQRLKNIPEPQVGFNYLGRIDQGLDINHRFALVQESVGSLRDPAAQRAHKLAIDASIIADELHIEWSYSCACYLPETVGQLADRLLRLLDDFATACSGFTLPGDPLTSDGPGQAPTALDLTGEAHLDAAIVPGSYPSSACGGSCAILLTGVTGFVGAFLLDELLTQTQGPIYCLVRSDSTQDAAARIEATLNRYGISNPLAKHRVVPVSGNLAKPLFGLSETQFRALGKEIDVIYHNGSATNLLLPYPALKPANVFGTQEILRLACTGTVKPVHYVSTLSIFDDGSTPKPPGFSEDELPGLTTCLTMGYSQTKLVAEHLLQIARGRGVPVTVYRLGAVTGHSRTGAWNVGDFHCRFLKMCLDLGLFPSNKVSFALTPVDFVSQAIVALATIDAAPGLNYHICNPHPTPVAELMAWLTNYGYRIEKASSSQWLGAFSALVSALPEHPLHTMAGRVETFVEHLHDNTMPYQFGRTLAALQQVGIALPTLDESMFGKSLDYLVDVGLLGRPLAQHSLGQARRA
jgi:amino acid adenylation domain-containing protein/thioester reductase-like protein/non-ribosomal peptide synthase protein (TIGR01720 family)